LRSDDSLTVANCILILCNRLIRIPSKQIDMLMETFKKEGGFTEALTTERLASGAEKSATEGAPMCPKCGKPMIKRMAKKGINSGNEFWRCSGYPNCNGTRRV